MLSLTSVLVISISVGLFSGVMAGLLGIGGGTIIVPVLFALFHQAYVPDEVAMPMALATTLAALVLTTAGSALSHLRLGHSSLVIIKRYVPWMMLGALIASQIAGRVNEEWLTWFFPFFLLYVAVRISEVLPKPKKIIEYPPLTFWQQRLYALCFGNLAVFLGLAGGILLIPHLIKRHQLSMPQAIGTSVACGFGTVVVGMLGYMLYPAPLHDLPGGSIGYVYWPAALIIGVSGIFTAPLGALLAKRLPVLVLKRFFAGMLIIIAISMWLS